MRRLGLFFGVSNFSILGFVWLRVIFAFTRQLQQIPFLCLHTKDNRKLLFTSVSIVESKDVRISGVRRAELSMSFGLAIQITQIKRPNYANWAIYPELGNQWFNGNRYSRTLSRFATIVYVSRIHTVFLLWCQNITSQCKMIPDLLALCYNNHD